MSLCLPQGPLSHPGDQAGSLHPEPPTGPLKTLPHFSTLAGTSVSSVCARWHPMGLGLTVLVGGSDSWRGWGRKKGICPVPGGNQPSASAAPGPATARAAPASPAPLPLRAGGHTWGLGGLASARLTRRCCPKLPGLLFPFPTVAPELPVRLRGFVVPRPRCRPCRCSRSLPGRRGLGSCCRGGDHWDGSLPGAPAITAMERRGSGRAPRSHRPEAAARPLPPAPPGNLITAGRPLLPPASPQTRWQTGGTVSSSLAAGLILG